MRNHFEGEIASDGLKNLTLAAMRELNLLLLVNKQIVLLFIADKSHLYD